MLQQERVLLTDTTMRDAHQSLLATRFRTHDMAAIAPYYASLVPNLFSVECWGGATFDVAMRFLNECPWERLHELRAAMPNLLLQMLLRSANAVGYTNYPDNVVQYFVDQAARAGIDLFRVFDSLNWVDNMRVAIDAVRESGKLCEAAICYTGQSHRSAPDQVRPQVLPARSRASLKRAGAHILGIKDMAGLCQPRAAYTLVKALKEEIGLPIHFHTHDTSGIAAASVLAAVDAGADAVDGAMDSMSGLTSQPNLGSIVEALRHGPRDSGVDAESLRVLSGYWEQVRHCYAAFESDLRSGASEVYVHGMPGGQFTNLREQARSLGIDDVRWPEVARAYAQVNEMFGDIVKVTPTSKVVGDHGADDGDERAHAGAGARSAHADRVSRIGRLAVPRRPRPAVRRLPAGAAEESAQGRAAVDGAAGRGAAADRPGARRAPSSIARPGARSTDEEFASYLMYPKVFLDYMQARLDYGQVSVLPTPLFFYGMEPGDEVTVDIERGKTLIVRFVAVSDGSRGRHAHRVLRAEWPAALGQSAGPQPGRAQAAASQGRSRQRESRRPRPCRARSRRSPVSQGGRVTRGDVLLTIEAMKMETSVRADRDATVAEVVTQPGEPIDAKDLLVVLA